VRDFLEVLGRRWPGVEVLIIPVRVQGQGAAAEIAGGLSVADRLRPRPDVIVATRGGGSLEDLWCFNEEAVVRAIHACSIPVVSAVGHEIDVTLADLAADVRALTPSEAAERVVPSAEELSARVRSAAVRMRAALRHQLRDAQARLAAIARSRALTQPLDRVHMLAQRLDDLQARGDSAMGRLLERRGESLRSLAARLEALSPLAVLGRGYSLTRRDADGAVLRGAGETAPGELLRTRLSHGEVLSRVEECDPKQ